MPLNVKHERLTNAMRLDVSGEMNIYTAPDLKAAFMDALYDAPALELNLTEVEEMDSAGLQLLVLARRECHARGKGFSIISHSAATNSVVRLLGLEELYVEH